MRKKATESFISFNCKGVNRTLILSSILLGLASLIGCYQASDEHKQLTINVVPFYVDTPITCDGIFHHKGEKWQINTLSFFVSTPEMTENTTRQSLTFVETEWQTSNVALVWFANNCDAQTTKNKTLTLNVSPTSVTNADDNESTKTLPTRILRFSMGVPFSLNHGNPLLQASPLNIPEMFWSWRNGYKFMRFDASATEYSGNWSLHLGSLACQSASSLRAPTKPCAMPNLFEYEVNLPDVERQEDNALSIKFDIALLIDKIELTQDNSCMFDYSQQNQCQLIINNLQQNPIFSTMSQP